MCSASECKVKVADPDIGHIRSSEYEHVYEPSEDTFLLMSVIDADAGSLAARRPSICVEIGCGSGIVISHMSAALRGHGFHGCTFLGVDINPRAAQIAAETMARNHVLGGMIMSDFGAGFGQRLRQKVDILIFNPPYVPSEQEELGQTDLTAAWAGGHRGRQVIDRFVPQVDFLLSRTGVFYLVVIEKNDPDEIIKLLKAQGFDCEVKQKRKVCGERLRILGFSRS